MEQKEALDRYSHYYDYLQKLGKAALYSNVTIEYIEPSRGLIQSVYKEIKKHKFNGNLVDYLCWISMQYVLWQAKHSIKNLHSSRQYAEIIIKNFEMLQPDTLNLLRLFNKRPEYLFDWIYANDKDNKIKHTIIIPQEKAYNAEYYDDINCYTLLGSFWFLLYREHYYYTEKQVEVYYPADFDKERLHYLGLYKPVTENKK